MEEGDRVVSGEEVVMEGVEMEREKVVVATTVVVVDVAATTVVVVDVAAVEAAAAVVVAREVVRIAWGTAMVMMVASRVPGRGEVVVAGMATVMSMATRVPEGEVCFHHSSRGIH